jgi:hypothetical protein
MKKKTLRSALYDLQNGEYLYIYDPIIPFGARRTNGVLESLDPTNIYQGWRRASGLKEFDKFKDSPFRIFQNPDDFWLEFRHDYLEPALAEAILSGSEVNYKAIQEEVDLYSGQGVIVDNDRYRGYYFVGATYGVDDFYWLYWNPTERTFKFSSCVGPLETLDPSNTLSMEQTRNLREDVKYIHDAPFPSDLLLSPLG